MKRLTYTFALIMAVVASFTAGYTVRPESPEPIQIVNYTTDVETELVQSPDGQLVLEIHYEEQDGIEWDQETTEQGAGAWALKLQGLQ